MSDGSRGLRSLREFICTRFHLDRITNDNAIKVAIASISSNDNSVRCAKEIWYIIDDIAGLKDLEPDEFKTKALELCEKRNGVMRINDDNMLEIVV